MKMNEAIKTAMKSRGITQQKMADMLGYELGQRTVANKLTSQNMQIETVLKFLNEIDYELVIKPKTRGKRKEDEILITSKGEE